MRTLLSIAAILVLLTGLSGCFNENESTLSLGSVSVGQQLIDLERAKSSGAISKAEHKRLRATLLSLLDVAADDHNERASDADEEITKVDAEDDTGFTWF